MDNKKLMHILLRDIKELEQLTGEMKEAGAFDALDIELILTRISGVRHLLEVAGETKESGIPPATHEKKEPSAPAREIQQEEPKKPAPPVVEKISNTHEGESAALKPSGNGMNHTVIEPEVLIKQISEVRIQDMGTREETITQAEELAKMEKQTLGEKFTAGKSFNDLLFERNKSDQKFSNMPVSNLAGAIGINDRFLFTRELFDGNADAFNDTVKKIDTMHSILEAADFLRERYQWNKSETSLKFIDLVKRRFL